MNGESSERVESCFRYGFSSGGRRSFDDDGGRRDGDWVGCRWFRHFDILFLLGSEDWVGVDERVGGALLNGRGWRDGFELRRKEGSEGWMEGSELEERRKESKGEERGGLPLREQP